MTNEDVIVRTEYPPGVPCLIDTEQPDPDAAAEFYRGVFGWEFENMLPPGIDDKYLVASVNGLDVAAIASPTPGVEGAPRWNTYVSVADVDATTAQAVSLGARVEVAPVDAGPPGKVAGRWAALVDPDGAPIRLWQPGYRHGAQLVNRAGSWNSSDLTTSNVDGAKTFYGAIFGWQTAPVEFGAGEVGSESWMWQLPGYGDFLAIGDPDIKRRHAEPWVPEGFSDVIGWMTAMADSTARWTVTFSADNTDAATERAAKFGGTVVLPPFDVGGGAVRLATLRDPQGAEFMVGTFDPTVMAAG
jgi:predicted enzyme related to lactoylglutathione lyase